MKIESQSHAQSKILNDSELTILMTYIKLIQFNWTNNISSDSQNIEQLKFEN